MGAAANEWLIVADYTGRVVADSGGGLLVEQLSSAQLAQGAPIYFDGHVVGTLLIPIEASERHALDQHFLSRVNRSLLWAGLAAAAVALALGLILARQLTAPLRTLTQAVQRLTKRGSVTALAGVDPLKALPAGLPNVPQLEIRSQDEIGQLSAAFDEMTQSLAQQETLRRNLMADIAHELRTPLSVMQGDLEALLDGVYQPSAEALASLHEETVLLSRLVDDLRALALAEAGQLHLQRQPTDLNELLAGVVSSFDLQAESQGQVLQLAPLTPSLELDVDPQRVRQVVSNLVSNALRHAAGPGGNVLVSAEAKDGEVQISVTDSGPGIPAEELPHVFDRFWRGDRTRVEGSGLGLAIARELVRAHGGRIWVESTPGHGSAFHFTLPVR